jgi:hypothetical protein
MAVHLNIHRYSFHAFHPNVSFRGWAFAATAAELEQPMDLLLTSRFLESRFPLVVLNEFGLVALANF